MIFCNSIFSFRALIVLFALISLSSKAKKDVHYTDFMKPKDDEQANKRPNPSVTTNDSHKFLNYQSKNKQDPSKMNRQHLIASEIPLGHTSRKEFIPLMDQRNKLEKSVNHSFTLGILLRKLDPKKGQPLITYAHEQQKKSQEVQRKMNQVKSAGHIDQDRIVLDAFRLANEKNKYSSPPKAERTKEQRISDLLHDRRITRQRLSTYHGESRMVLERYRAGSSSKDVKRHEFSKQRKPN